MKNIVLIGFMGTGKTSVGKLIAARLNRCFIDVDKKIEAEQNMSINEIFAKYGEEKFRQIESEVIAKISRYTNVVVSTGGGAMLRAENRKKLAKNSVIISLDASVEAIIKRTSKSDNRPLLNVEDKEEKISNLLKERDEAYKKADYVIDTSCYSLQDVAENIIVFLRQGGYLNGRDFG